MTTDKPSRNEEEYFARQEAERLKARRAAAAEAAEQAERQSHFMKCPKCGVDLRSEDYLGIKVDRCPGCNGAWFDAGEVDALGEREDSGIGGIFTAIVRGVKTRTAPEPGDPE